MSRYLINPNLPEYDVDKVIIGDNDPLLTDKLSELGIESVLSKKNPSLLDGISNHSDLHVFHKGGNSFLLDFSQNELVKDLPDSEITFLINMVKSPYPEDCRLNAADIGDYIICNKKAVDADIIQYAADKGKTIINVAQGYSNCSIAVIDRNKFITDDPSIYNETFRISGIKALLVSKGSVKLKGMDYGFIGGCTGLIGHKHILFNGDIAKHKDHRYIIDFLIENDIIFTDIKEKELTDIGGIIPVTEKG
ncbi:MAG: hypothetical protein K5761_00220 [Clostridiales bacterium]|nr:hypothetical protein [Clostridiales bacterium]